METKEALAEVRKRAGLTQDEMAARLFVTRQAVSRWENGETTPGVDLLKEISRQFGVSTDALLGRSGFACQSCSMPLVGLDDFGTEADGGLNTGFCVHCYRDGSFTHDRTIDEMVESNLRFLDKFNEENGTNLSKDDARRIFKAHLSSLERWRR